MNQTQTAPRWNLSSIYPSITSAEYTQDSAEIDTLQQKLTQALESSEIKTDFSTWLYTFIQQANRLYGLFTSMYSYAYALYSTDTTNTAFINNISTLEEKNIGIEQISLKFRTLFSQVCADSPETLSKLYTTYPQLEQYSFIFSEDLLFSSHQMKPELEKLASEMALTGAESWSRLQEQIISTLVCPANGKTFNEIRNEAYNADVSARKTAWEQETALLESVKIPLAACLNNIKGSTATLNKRRNWESALAKSTAQSRISPKTLEALISAIENSLPFWQSYLETKAHLLYPQQSNPSLPFYDLFAPLTKPRTSDEKSADAQNTSEKIWTFPEAQEYIIEKFTSFSADMGSFAQRAFAEHWIDAEVRKGKVGGAYCTDFPVQKVSRVLSNFTGAFSDITTLAHELGHAYHFQCVKDLDFQLGQYPMTLAETASNFAETIVQKDIIAHSSGFSKIRMIEMHLQDSCQVLVDILSRFYFERSVFEKRADGELSPEDFCTLMTDAQERTYGKVLSVKHPYMWALKSHYYGTDLDFYNFPYAFGMLFSAGLYARYEKEGESFAHTYKALLHDTGRLSCEDVCAAAGFDIQTPDFWESGITTLSAELAELQAYART